MTPTTWDFDAIGTRWQIETPQALDDGVRTHIEQRIADFDAVYSRFRSDSLITRIATEPGGTFCFPPDAGALFDLYDRLAALTDGAVDPLVGHRLAELGYDSDYTLRPSRSAAPERLNWTSDVVRAGTTVTTRGPVLIDVGAAGKGYLVDLVTALLHEAGVPRFVIDAGGDLRRRGPGTIRVGLEDPRDPRRVIGVARLGEQALAASAVNRRVWGDGLHHVLDARTGRPAQRVTATWVIAGTAAEADGLATALFFTPAHRLAEAFTFTSVRLFADGRAETSPGFDGELFLRIHL
jgi:thiamine biosynthesis lipoprotein